MPLLISITGADLPDENEGTVGIYEGSGGIVGIFFSDLNPSQLIAQILFQVEKGKPFGAELL